MGLTHTGTLVALSACLLAGAVAARAEQAGSAAGSQTAPRTSRDRVYLQDQAERGAAQYAKLCAACHDADKVPDGKKAEAPLVGEKFVAEWQGRTLGELLTTILLTMPNDGSATLSESETEDIVAYILRANGYPAGAALKYGAGKDIVIVK